MTNIEFWEGCYQKSDTPWDKGEASPGLVEFLKSRRLGSGNVLVPGCGSGHDVRAWANMGLRAVGLDFAPSAIDRARSNSSSGNCEYWCLDFLSAAPIERFDWLFEHTCFCAIDPSLRAAYADAVSRWLKPGGHYLAINYHHYESGGPPFTTTRDELKKLFDGNFRLLEEWMPVSYPNRTFLERAHLWKCSQT